jgi:hypothetical protein
MTHHNGRCDLECRILLWEKYFGSKASERNDGREEWCDEVTHALDDEAAEPSLRISTACYFQIIPLQSQKEAALAR